MARFCCRDCNTEGTFSYSGKHECPQCGSVHVQFALAIEELDDDDPLIFAMTKPADDSTEQS
jgi:hypothetical protein